MSNSQSIEFDIESVIFPSTDRLHRAFLLIHKGTTYFGINNHNLGESYPIVDINSICGQLIAIQAQEKSTKITYLKTPRLQKAQLFESLSGLDEVVYPFPLLDLCSNPVIATNNWWSEADPKKLNDNEQILRNAVIQSLDKWVSKTEKLVVYDPACSTAEFLLQYRHNFPKSKIIASDVSETMVIHAKNKIDQVFISDAQNAKQHLSEKIDVLFLRFLNYEVVTNTTALAIIKELTSIVNTNGLIVVFGYTPVLPIVPLAISNLGFSLINSILKIPNTNSFVQMYVFKRNK